MARAESHLCQVGPSNPGWFCPLLGRDICEGCCYEVNVEASGFFKPSTLAAVQRESGKSLEEVRATCEVCPSQPWRD